MNKYRNMKWEEMRELSIEEFDKIPEKYIEKAVEDFKKRWPPQDPILVKDIPIN